MVNMTQPSVDDFVLSMPDDLLTSEAINQITGQNSDVFGYRNFVEIFDIKHTIQENARETDEDENEAEAVEYHQNQRDAFYGAVIKGMKDISGILLDTRGHDNLLTNVKDLYDMFIVQRHRNLVEFILYYILHNKTSLANRFNDDKITNMTVKNARKEFGNKIDATLAIHAYDIVIQILGDDEVLNPENFIELLYQSSPEDMQYLMAHSMYGAVALSFDVPRFINLIRTIYSNPVNLSYLQSDVIERLVERLKFSSQNISQ